MDLKATHFLMEVEEIKNKTNTNFMVGFKNTHSKVYYSDPPYMILNRKLLSQGDDLYGVFYHELGHIINPVDNSLRSSFILARTLSLAQILFIPFVDILGKVIHFNTGINAVFATFSLFYLIKFLLNRQFKDLSDELQKNEYLADAFSHLNDPTQSLLKRFKRKKTILMLADILVRALPVFALITHPMINKRIKALEEQAFIDKVKKI